MNDVEEAIHESGHPLVIRGGGETRNELGIKSGDGRSSYVLFGPEVRVHPGDWIADEFGSEYLVIEIDPIRDQRQLEGLKARYKTKQEHEADQAASLPSTTHNWTIGQAPGAIFNTGVQYGVSIHNEFRGIEELIDERAADPEQAAELKEIVAELERQMEQDGAVKGGVLARLNRWGQATAYLTGPLSNLLMRFLSLPPA